MNVDMGEIGLAGERAKAGKFRGIKGNFVLAFEVWILESLHFFRRLARREWAYIAHRFTYWGKCSGLGTHRPFAKSQKGVVKTLLTDNIGNGQRLFGLKRPILKI